MNTRQFALGVVLTFTLILFFNSHTSAFHENLGIDDNKASELYHANPNDPAIVQWKSALQSAINGMDNCFEIQEAISCQSLISNITSHCKSHPNTLLACNDARLAQYPLILKNAKEAQAKAEEAQAKAEAKAEEEQRKATEAKMEDVKREYASKFKENVATIIINRCINTNSDTSCDGEMRSLQSDCQNATSPYNYCKDERFVGYLTQHNISNSTVSPSSNLTGNSSSSNSTYP
jgi:hypothetical protein